MVFQMTREKLDKMFNPKVVAVVGATNNKNSVGYAIFRNLIGNDFDGIVYPVNPKREGVQGVKAYPSIKDIPDKVDLAVIATPAPTVPGIVEECGKCGVSGIVITSAGFSEMGEEGEKAADGMLRTARKYGMRIIGPNCLGLIKPSINLNATFGSKIPKKGRIAFISQSGALGTAMLDWSVNQNVGFSYFVSIGSMIDVSFHDLIDYFGSDPETSSIVIYMESLKDARKFLSAARSFARNKPIVVLKSGKSEAGAKAAKSHTGALAGNDYVFDAAFRRAGIVRVNEIGELFDCAQTLSMQRRPKGKRLAIVTNAGGPGVIATDALSSLGGEMASFSRDSEKKLRNALPPMCNFSNPIDVLGDAGPDRFRLAIDVCMEDRNVDGILVMLTPQAMTDADGIAREIGELNKLKKKTMLASWMGGRDVMDAKDILKKSNIPVYETPEHAVKSFMYMHRYARNIELLYETPATIPHAIKPKTEENRKIIQSVFDDGRKTLTEQEAKEFLSNYEIPVTKSGVARTAKEARKMASDIGFPVVMKILSPDILHKTDVGGVKLNIMNEKDVSDAFNDIIKSAKKHVPKADIRGVFVEQMISKKYELLIGSKRDTIFGPAILFGMGGVAVEVFKDTNVGLPPLNMMLAKRLIEETKIYNLLRGYRGMKGVDISTLEFLLYKFAYLLQDFPEIKEIDINPFGIDEKGGVVLDAKIVIEECRKDRNAYGHMVISPYPKEYVTEFKMNDGRTAILRPIRPEDEHMEGEMFTKFSEQTQRFRFFELIKDITHDMLIRYTQIDYDREIAIIAEIEERGRKKMAGVVRLIADPYNETAEFAIVVADPWQNLGLGDRFTDYILEIARKRGIKKVYANFMKENHIMRKMFEKRGFKITANDDDCYAELELEHLGKNRNKTKAG
ncbi:MAG: bifunctional acetate--CoA ligase family protein/GNAT family N-acetyltransferase [Candidatus Aenigmarchaeota archaeon]|nr:bifunctional acetate--CoA ligase family protein/GNAT family N-acetyltransferase [Candidatus Aenigmarchaeota archaeon]